MKLKEQFKINQDYMESQKQPREKFKKNKKPNNKKKSFLKLSLYITNFLNLNKLIFYL